MATVTGLTAERMLEIEAASVVDGEVVGDNLVLTKHDGTTINAGNVRGLTGPAGADGDLTLEGLADALLDRDRCLSVTDFGAVGDGVNDDTAAFVSWRNELVSSAGDRWGYIPPGLWRLTQSIDLTNVGGATVPVTIRGAGSRQTYLIGDFVGAGSGIIDISNPDDDVPGRTFTAGHRISGIGFLGRGRPGDPIGLKALNAQEHYIDDLDAPAAGQGVPNWSGNATGWALANSIVVCTNDNNSKWFNIRTQGGFQPKAYNIPTLGAKDPITGAAITPITATINAGSNVITSSAAAFTAGMVNKIITFASGSGDSNAIWRARIAGFTSSTEITIDGTAPSTASGVHFAVSFIRASITAGSKVLDFVDGNIQGLSNDWVGMQVHVLGASTKGDAGSTPGVLSTTIESVNVAAREITLVDAATVSVTGTSNTDTAGWVVFAPGVFIGSFEGDPLTRQNNHSWWTNLMIEGYSAAGLIVNQAIYTTFVNLKVHGAGYSYADDWDRCYFNMILSEVKSIYMDKVQAAYGILNEKVHISGSRGLLKVRDAEFGSLVKDKSVFLIASATDDFRLDVEDIFITSTISNFSDDWSLVNTTQPWCVVSSGPLFLRDNKNGKYTKTPPVVAAGFTGQSKRIQLPSSGGSAQVYSFKPPGQFGLIMITSDLTGCSIVARYRAGHPTLANAMGQVSNEGAGEVITAPTTLDGTNGTADRLQVAVNATGHIQICNRRTSGGSTINVAVAVLPFGSV